MIPTKLSIRRKVCSPLDKSGVVGGNSAERDGVESRHELNRRLGLDKVETDKVGQVYSL